MWSHERLDYANLSEGEIVRSTLPALAGLSVRGPWIPQFEELVRYSDREIPREDGLLMIPGEDLFYYTTGRHPRFPVLMFDHTLNPYSPEEIVKHRPGPADPLAGRQAGPAARWGTSGGQSSPDGVVARGFRASGEPRQLRRVSAEIKH